MQSVRCRNQDYSCCGLRGHIAGQNMDDHDILVFPSVHMNSILSIVLSCASEIVSQVKPSATDCDNTC